MIESFDDKLTEKNRSKSSLYESNSHVNLGGSSSS